MNWEFDILAVLETCNVQCVTLEKAEEDSKQFTLDYDEKFEIFTKNRENWRNLCDELNITRFNVKRNLGVGENDTEEIFYINTTIEGLFKEITKLNFEMTKISQQFNEKNKEMANQELNLMIQFAEHTINESIDVTEKNFNSFHDSELQLISTYEKLHTFETEDSIYQKIDGLSVIIDELQSRKKEKIDVNKLAEKEKNIAFLISAYKSNKEKMDLLN